MRAQSHWGWGFEDARPSLDEQRAAAPGLVEHLGFGSVDVEAPVPLSEVTLTAPRVVPPAHLREIAATDTPARARHAQGRSFVDVARGFRGSFPSPPDFVVTPRTEDEVGQVLEWASGARVALTPWGGGTSVVGGATPEPGPGHEGAVTLSLAAMDRVLEVDEVSLAARVQAGASGPALESQLASSGLTLRFFPQSFELSTLGGWIVTRAGGHFATGPTHIDDAVESVRALTPTGEVWESRRLPASGAGPSPDRMLLGSEGVLGVVTSAWVRVLRRPSLRAGASVRFPAGFFAGAAAVRALLQDGLRPSNCRLLSPEEARLTFAGDGSHAVLVLGFESDARPLDADASRALAICAEHGGESEGVSSSSGRSGAAGAWRDAFLRAPYLRDQLLGIGVVSETFETAVTWDRFEPFVEAVLGSVREALGGAGGFVGVRLTHAYPDGAAPYFTVVAPAGSRGGEVEQWLRVKSIAGDAILRAGGTITHHHAVGRDHLPWYRRQRPDPFATALRAAKDALDPAGVLNPGVLL